MGERIRKYRRMQEFSQEKAAEQANLPQKYFSRLKRRQDNPNTELQKHGTYHLIF